MKQFSAARIFILVALLGLEVGCSGEVGKDDARSRSRAGGVDADAGGTHGGQDGGAIRGEDKRDSVDSERIDFGSRGPYAVRRTPGTRTTQNGCVIAYESMEPTTTRTDATLFMAHGFVRSIEDQAAMAEHIASFGIRVVTVGLCTNSVFGVDHRKNGEAMVQLGQALVAEGRVYAGFSAGGLAAWVATSQDSGAIGYLGLDPVDHAGLAREVASGIKVPVYASLSEPGACNNNNDFSALLGEAAGAVRIVDAQHFDYEQPTCAGLVCRLCAPTGGEVSKLVRGMTTAGAGVLTGAYPGARSWWIRGGVEHDANEAAGRIESL